MADLIRPEVKHLLVHFPPDDPTHFGVRVQALIGSTDSDLFDAFDVRVCSPHWLAGALERQLSDDGAGRHALNWGYRSFPPTIVLGAQFWVMNRWDEVEVRRLLDVICDEVGPGPDWGSVASRIARFIPWEFDYRYDAHEQAGGGVDPRGRR